ncbi:MAG TPA: hypothetical protein VMV86_06270 [Methanosarcinales archaeon]|nr:hypothetical protein [Methanosarcinales archaeon]
MVKTAETLSIRETYKLLNIAIATAKLKELRTPYAKIRPSLHTVLIGKPGTLKSSILYEICDKLKTTPHFNLTAANIVGSVDSSTGEPMLPAIWEARDSILAIDDFNVDKDHPAVRNGLRILLSVLENPEYQKKISYRVNDYSKKTKGLYCIMKNGTIKVKTRFVLVANTMNELHKPQKMVELEALRTRCLTIPYYPSIDETIEFIQGKNRFEYEDYPMESKVKVPLNVFNKIIELVKTNKVIQTDFVRTIGDCCRVYAVVGDDDDVFESIIKLKHRGGRD